MIDGIGKSPYSLIFNIVKVLIQIGLIMLLKDMLPYGLSILVGITIGELMSSAMHYITIKLLIKKFKKNIDTLVVS